MTSKHHKWQTRWRLDLAARRATHESGLVVEFAPNGRAQNMNGPQYEQTLAQTHGPHNAPLMLARLLREAERLLKEADHGHQAHAR